MKPPFGIAQMGKSFRNEVTVEHFIFRLRIRTDGNGILLRTRQPSRMDELLEGSTHELVAALRQLPGMVSPSVSTKKTSSPTTPTTATTSNISTPGAGTSSKASPPHRPRPARARRSQRSKTALRRSRQGRPKHRQETLELSPLRHRAGRRRHPRRAGLPARCLPRRRTHRRQGQARHPHRAEAAPAPGCTIKCAVLPLVNKGRHARRKAREVIDAIPQGRHPLPTRYDVRLSVERAAIGKRYAKHDEVGTPYHY